MTAAQAMTSVTGKRSFTFIELLFVVIIIGVLIGVSFPNLKKTFNTQELNSFSSRLQTLINYLAERSVVEEKIIYLFIDRDQGLLRVKYKDAQSILKQYSIPSQLQIELDNNSSQFAVYPDGTIDKLNIKLINRDNASVTLTTKGIYGKARLEK
jgi:type II secretory pathway pseudopilin PulG